MRLPLNEEKRAKDAPAHRVARDLRVVVNDAVDERAVAQRAARTTRRERRSLGVCQHAGEVLGVGADRETDRVGVTRRDLDHLAPGRRNLHGYLRHLHPIEPLEAACETLPVNGLTTQISLHADEIALEAGDAILALADPLHRGIAATDPEDGTPLALRL